MSKTYEIKSTDWGTYLNELSKRERLHPVHIEVEGQDLGDELLTKTLPLQGLSLDTAGDAADLMVGRQRDGQVLDHRISNVSRIYVEETDDGRVQCVDIEDSSNTKTLIHFD